MMSHLKLKLPYMAITHFEQVSIVGFLPCEQNISSFTVSQAIKRLLQNSWNQLVFDISSMMSEMTLSMSKSFIGLNGRFKSWNKNIICKPHMHCFICHIKRHLSSLSLSILTFMWRNKYSIKQRYIS